MVVDQKVDLILKESQRSFDYELKRNELLTSKAEKYVLASWGILTLGLISVDNQFTLLGTCLDAVANWLTAFGFAGLGLALAMALLSFRPRADFIAYPRGTKIIDELSPPAVTENEAAVKIAKMYFANSDANAEISDERAKYLGRAGWLLASGFILALISKGIKIFSVGV